MPKVAVIILNWNGWADTLECLESLNQTNYENFEIILIDNASKERKEILPAQFSSLKIRQIFNDKNLGFAGGNNQGIKMALEDGVDYILLLNNDTTVEPNFLKELVEAGEEDKKTGILGPKMFFYSARDLIWSAGGKILKNYTRGELIGYQEKDEGRFDEKKEVDYISGTCLLIKKQVIEKIGEISEDYFLYYEDTDWNMRARRAGFKCVFVPNSKIYHKASKSTGEFSYPYIYYHSRNGLIFAWRFGLKIAVIFSSVWIFKKQVFKLMIGYKKQWARPVLRGVWDFWRGERGKLEGYY